MSRRHEGHTRGQLVALLAALIVAGCSNGATPAEPPASAPESATLDLNETAPWTIWDAAGGKTPCPNKDGWLTPEVKLTAAARKVLLRLDLAELPGLDSCAPVALVDFEYTIDVPAGLAGPGYAPSGNSPFWIDQTWQWHEPNGSGWQNLHGGQCHRQLPRSACNDATALGLYISLNDKAPADVAFCGVVRVRIDKLTIRTGARRHAPLPEKGQVERSVEAGWRIEPGYRGGTQVVAADHGANLACDLDATDPNKLSAVARADIPLTDMRNSAVFVTFDVPAGLVSPDKFKAGAHAGLYCGKEIYWGPWQTLTHAGPVTLALHPEVRFPLPLSFRSAGFDPAKIDSIAIRLTVDQATRMKFAGNVAIQATQIVRMTPAFMAERDRVADALDRRFPPPATGPDSQARLPIAEFVRNVGVNYPWPKDDRGQGIYPVVGAKVWDSTNNRWGGLELRGRAIGEDFAKLAQARVALVRVWLLGDLRHGFQRDPAGRMTMNPACKDDLEVLLAQAEKARIDLLPVLLDFTVADGNDRERLATIGEWPEIFTDPAARGQFLDCIQPLLERLCRSPAVRMIDLCNEPGQMAVPMDAVAETLAELAGRIRRLPDAKPLTIGARNSIDLRFWQRVRPDVPTFHWFAKMEPGYGKASAPAGVPRNGTIVTEIEATGGVAATLTQLWEAGFAGGLVWSMNADDGISPFGPEQAGQFRQWVIDHLPDPSLSRPHRPSVRRW